MRSSRSTNSSTGGPTTAGTPVGPHGILTGMVKAVGWQKYQGADNPRPFVVPETTLGDLAVDLKRRVKMRTLRVLVDPGMKLAKVALDPGSCPIAAGSHLFRRDDVEALGLGESPRVGGGRIRRRCRC